MALQYNAKTTQVGVAFSTAYAKISDFTGSPEQGVRFTVAVYADKAARGANANPVDFIMLEVPYDSTSGEIMAYGYAQLKADARFAGAVNV